MGSAFVARGRHVYRPIISPHVIEGRAVQFDEGI